MSFAQDNGYTPETLEEIISAIRVEINSQFSTSYTADTFIGTGWYKYVYAAAQKIQSNEVKSSEIFSKLQEYIALTNDRIQRPSVSMPGLIESLESEGYTASVKAPIEADAGKIFVCLELDSGDDDYAEDKLAVCTLLSQYVSAGMVFMGTETESIVLSNGQAFDFKFALPDVTPLLLRATIVTSENTALLVPTDEEIRLLILTQFEERYRLGNNFEPERYYNQSDAEWAESVLLEWSDDDGANYDSTVIEAAFDDLYTVDLADISVVVT